MSPALIRCLLAILALSDACGSVCSKDVAQLLGLKRPTVHRSLSVLQEKGLIHKQPYGDVHLTESGLETARIMDAQRDELTLFFSALGLSPEEAIKAALALMSTLSPQSLQTLLHRS